MKTPVSLEHAVFYTVLYADIFQYPLTKEEVYRYLIGMKSSQLEVSEMLRILVEHKGSLIKNGPYYLLPGREEIAQTRVSRLEQSLQMWPKAISYGKWIAQLPFIRMVAVTGSLAMNNADLGSDLDYLVVTSPGRLWFARGLVTLLVRLAALRKDHLCPNYFLSERALALTEQNIFTAHEMAQMVPLSGREVYTRMWQANPWVGSYLPNAGESKNPDRYIQAMLPEEETRSRFQSISENLLDNPADRILETWVMRRKLRQYEPMSLEHAEACFGPDWCKGHVDDHEEQTLDKYSERLQLIERMLV